MGMHAKPGGLCLPLLPCVVRAVPHERLGQPLTYEDGIGSSARLTSSGTVAHLADQGRLHPRSFGHLPQAQSPDPPEEKRRSAKASVSFWALSAFAA